VTDSFAFLSGLITGFFSAFKGGYEIRRKMLMISAIAEGTCKNWRRTVHLWGGMSCESFIEFYPFGKFTSIGKKSA